MGSHREVFSDHSSSLLPYLPLASNLSTWLFTDDTDLVHSDSCVGIDPALWTLMSQLPNNDAYPYFCKDCCGVTEYDLSVSLKRLSVHLERNRTTRGCVVRAKPKIEKNSKKRPFFAIFKKF